MLSRRTFLKGLGLTGIAVAVPSLILPKPRTIISPDATLFLPPAEGWLAGERSLDKVVEEIYAPRGRRSVTLYSAIGQGFPEGTMLTLQHVGDQITNLGQVVVGAPVSRVVLNTASRATYGLQVVVSHGDERRVVHLHDQSGWAGDFERHVSAFS
jgi:hypothetical protein